MSKIESLKEISHGTTLQNTFKITLKFKKI